MNNLRLHLASRVLLAATLGLTVSLASAQRTNERNDPANLARARRFDRVHELCDLAASDLFELGGKAYTKEAHEVLAEAAVMQGQWIEALRQADACEEGQVDQRFAMTKALALISVGRTAEARTLVLDEIGTLERPGFFRQAQHIDRFPTDGNASVTALKATVCAIRGAWWQEAPERPETLEDLRNAVKLAGNSASLHLLLGKTQINRKDYGAAEAELALADSKGDPSIKKKVSIFRLDIFAANERAKAKAIDSKPGP